MTAPRRHLWWLLAFVVAGVGVVVASVSLNRPPPPEPRAATEPPGEPGVAPPPDGIGGAPATPARDREEALDRLEAAEAEQVGADEAARRRRTRERMLDQRAGEARR